MKRTSNLDERKKTAREPFNPPRIQNFVRKQQIS
jgi:hypothetical protein